MFVLVTELPGQTITAYKTGERTTGQTKQCYYDGLGSEYTRTISSIALCPLSIQVTTRNPVPAPTPAPSPRSTITAYKTGEETTGGTKQCYYDGTELSALPTEYHGRTLMARPKNLPLESPE
jgi:hypothetical protein